MGETDAEFLDSMEHDWVHDIIPNSDDAHRLFALARRGAAADAEIERRRAALRELADCKTFTDREYMIGIARAALEGK